MKRIRTWNVLTVLCIAPSITHADLIGVNYSTGDVYSISTADATATRLGSTVSGIMGLDRDRSGRLVGIKDGIGGSVGSLNVSDWQFSAIGNAGAGFTFEGGLAIGARGEIFAGSRLSGSGRAIFEIDPATGTMTRSITLSRTDVDLNGLQFRADGALVALDAVSAEFVSVDTGTGMVTTIAPLLSTAVGAVGGLAIDEGVGYFVTAGETSGSHGDNSLYRIDLNTGDQRLIGPLGAEAGAGFGIGALVGFPVPSPATALLVGGASAISLTRRRRVM